MSMIDRALKHFKESWDLIKSGDFFNEATNQALEYSLKCLWKIKKSELEQEIIKDLPSMWEMAKNLDTPAPFIYILISLKDEKINLEIQKLAILSWVNSNSSELETFNLINLIETFSEKQENIGKFITAIIKNAKSTMDFNMLEALASIICINHPEFKKEWLKKFLGMGTSGKEVLKAFVKMQGRGTLMELINVADPMELNWIFKEFNLR